MEGKKVVELVNQFEAFNQETGSDDLKHFSVWLNRKMSSGEKPQPEATEENRFLVWNIHRLSKYFRWYSKSYLNANGLNSMDEYFFLVSITRLGRPAKNEVYKDTLSELTTGAQMMKRLIDIGLVMEVVDEKDLRIKRVQLTALGEKTRANIFEQSKKGLVLKTGNLDAEEKRQLSSALAYLEKFHNDIYLNHYEKPIEDILEKFKL